MHPLRCLSLALLLLGMTLGVKPATAQTSAPRFDQAACPFPLGRGIVDGSDVRCGYLVVPEDYRRPDGPTTRLAVADFKGGTHADPLIFLQGGPGAGIVAQLGPAMTKDTLGTFASGHDLILLDQRGTGLSQPSLACPEFDRVTRRILSRRLDQSHLTALVVHAADACRDRLTQSGVDLNAYTTENDAADVAALGPALGYNQVNLYGVSYGTRVALTVMRLYPAGLRSVILDSVAPPQVNLYTQVPASMAHGFDTLYRGCAADAACNKAYPHLETTLLTVIDYLNAHPATLHIPYLSGGYAKVLLTGDNLVRVLFSALYTSRGIAVVPALVDAALRHHYSLLADAISTGVFEDPINEGVMYSVECSEDAPFVTAAAISQAVGALHVQLQPAQLADAHFGLTGYQVCQSWGARPVDPAQKEPVTSAIPTLILAGQYDPITPPSLGTLAAQTLSHSTMYTFPGLGHGLFLENPCATSIALGFLNGPTQPLNVDCLSTMTAPSFLQLPRNSSSMRDNITTG